MIIQYNGLISFAKGLELQEQAHSLVKSKGRPVCLGCEHYPVITLGKRSAEVSDLDQQSLKMKDLGFEIVKTDRGGQVTLHSPGQLVVYPIVPIRDYEISVRRYVQLLESSTLRFLSSLGIRAQAAEDAGVFTERGKIAFIGVRVDQGITRHGLSLNVSNFLSHFDEIQSCGVSKRAVDSVESWNIAMSPERAFELWTAFFIEDLIAIRSAQMGNG